MHFVFILSLQTNETHNSGASHYLYGKLIQEHVPIVIAVGRQEFKSSLMLLLARGPYKPPSFPRGILSWNNNVPIESLLPHICKVHQLVFLFSAKWTPNTRPRCLKRPRDPPVSLQRTMCGPTSLERILV